MKISIFYFSGTGNTWWVTEKIVSLFIEKGHNASTYSIERKDLEWVDLLPQVLKESDVIGIGYPVYGSKIPKIVKNWVNDFLCTSPKDETQAYPAFVFDTMAMFSGDTPLLMRKILRKCGFKVRQAINIRTLCNLPQMPRIMTWDKDKQEDIFKKAEAKCEKLVDYVLKDKKWVMRRDPLSRLIAGFQRLGLIFEDKIFRRWFVFDMNICNLCALCVKFCPVDNLSIQETETEPIIKYGLDCVYCMRCFNNCPQNAIMAMKRTRDIEKYRRFRGQVPDFKLSKLKKS
jgi:ferredoxin